MKINIWIKKSENSFNFDEIKQGNPGIGGTLYEVALLAVYLKERLPDEDVKIFTDNSDIKSTLFNVKHVQDSNQMFDEIAEEECILLYTHNSGSSDFYRRLHSSKVKAIVWVHNYLLYNDYINISNEENIVRVVFVGQQLYDHYIDGPFIDKATFIYNGVPESAIQLRIEDEIWKIRRNVVYVGNLSEQKGFHK